MSQNGNGSRVYTSDKGTMAECEIIGYVVKDPQLRYTKDETAVCNLTVVTKKERPMQDGNNNPVPCPDGWSEYEGNWQLSVFHNVTIWRGRAEMINQYVSKGDKVALMAEPGGAAEDGKLNPRIWQDNDGLPRVGFEWIMTEFEFFQKKDSNGNHGPEQSLEDALPF